MLDIITYNIGKTNDLYRKMMDPEWKVGIENILKALPDMDGVVFDVGNRMIVFMLHNNHQKTI